MQTITFFGNTEELLELTGLPDAKELWTAGFDLDDMDFGFVSDSEWTDGWWVGEASYYEHWLLNRMESYCVGYQHFEYNSKHYYILYHG
jgi:hypothetical protein